MGVAWTALVDGRVVACGADGLATPTGDRVTTATAFPVASLTKIVTTLTVLSLVSDGALDLDADVNDHLRSTEVVTPDDGRITLRRLLTHTAGFGVLRGRRDLLVPWVEWGRRRRTPRPTERRVGRPVRSLAAPGTTWSYGSHGHAVVETVIEDVTGSPFVEVATERVLGPLGMHEAGFHRPLGGIVAAWGARPRRVLGGVRWTRPRPFLPTAGGALWASTRDLAALVTGILAAPDAHVHRAVDADRLRELWTAQPFAGAEHPFQALGFRLGGLPDEPIAYHGGRWWGVRAHLVVAPRQATAIAVVGTGGTLGDVVRRVARDIGWEGSARGRAGGSPRRSALAEGSLIGTYRPRSRPLAALTAWSMLGGRVRVDAAHGRLVMRSRWGALWRGRRLHPLGDDRYAYRTRGGGHRTVAFRRTAHGAALFLTAPQAVLLRGADRYSPAP